MFHGDDNDDDDKCDEVQSDFDNYMIVMIMVRFKIIIMVIEIKIIYYIEDSERNLTDYGLLILMMTCFMVMITMMMMMNFIKFKVILIIT